MKKIFVAGHNGMVGSAILNALNIQGFNSIITANKRDLDLRNQEQVNNFFFKNKIDEVYLTAARVGGINANNMYPAEFIYENLMIQCNIIHAAHLNKVDKLLFLGSSCIYPKFANQPIVESALLGGAMELTNEPYAIAKIAGIKLCESYNRQFNRDYRCVMPTNLYGPKDNFDKENGHVIPALINRFHEAKINNLPEIKIWGSGKARREFLYSDDMAKAAILVMNAKKTQIQNLVSPQLSHINIGCGYDISIYEIAHIIAEIVSYKGKILWDINKPEGPPQKLLKVNLITKLGFKPSVNIYEGISKSYEYFKRHVNKEEN